jgi:outer membrane protein OmpA-like peptidoglycan-associated protein
MKRNSRHQQDEEEESIFISMTDIMVGLLFIFILIIMFFALQAKLDAEKINSLETERDRLTGLIGDGWEKRLVLDRYLENVTRHRSDILRWLQSYLIFQGVESVEIDTQNGILRLPEGVLFDSGKYNIKDNSPAAVTAKALAEGLARVLPCSVMDEAGVPFKPQEKCKRSMYHNKNMAFVEAIFLEGHTDNIQITRSLPGAPLLTSNLKLSARRSTNTFEEIIFHVPSLMQFHGPISSGNRPILAVSAYGETRPIASNTTRETRASNRRIDLRILMHKPGDVESFGRLRKEAGISVDISDP